MDQNKLLECIAFFNQLTVSEEDVTTDIERSQGYLVLVVTYQFKNKLYHTKKLYYRDISLQPDVNNSAKIQSYYGSTVYWLDHKIHKWPHGKGAEIERTVIRDMFEGENVEFEKLLIKIANNRSTGYLQEITWDGRSQQYGHNFENNNHWHDLINLVKFVISSKGNAPTKEYFQRLIFRWRPGNKGRDNLSDHFGNRALMWNLSENVKSIQAQLNKMELSKVLLNKKQIILQGPPGTGKTYRAKELARQLISSNKINFDSNLIKNSLTSGLEIPSAGNKTTYEIVSVDSTKCSVKGLESKEYSITFSSIIEAIEKRIWEPGKQQNGLDPYTAAIGKYLNDNINNLNYSKSEHIKLIQFHPAFTYEDFVRGISAKSSGNAIEYKTENKVLGLFAEKALHNFIDSKKDAVQFSTEKSIEAIFNDFVDFVQDEIDKKGRYSISDSGYINQMDPDAFRYTGDNWSSTFRIPFNEILKMYQLNIMERKEIKQQASVLGRAKQHATYYFNLLEKFRKFIPEVLLIDDRMVATENKYVLIIDEINRANLPAVLGELIYALEYRGEAVESMYDIDGENALIIPENLYIIGTMNTADRSVGHIDYAIRRRFAFVDVLPDAGKITFQLSKNLFNEISNLFVDNMLAPDFKAKEVQLGHSYFMVKDEEELRMKAKYEIIPLLEEYLKDGILLEEARQTVINLKERFGN